MFRTQAPLRRSGDCREIGGHKKDKMRFYAPLPSFLGLYQASGSRETLQTNMISRATAVLALAGSAAAFAPMGTPALRKPVSACSSTCTKKNRYHCCGQLWSEGAQQDPCFCSHSDVWPEPQRDVWQVYCLTQGTAEISDTLIMCEDTFLA